MQDPAAADPAYGQPSLHRSVDEVRPDLLPTGDRCGTLPIHHPSSQECAPALTDEVAMPRPRVVFPVRQPEASSSARPAPVRETHRVFADGVLRRHRGRVLDPGNAAQPVEQRVARTEPTRAGPRTRLAQSTTSAPAMWPTRSWSGRRPRRADALVGGSRTGSTRLELELTPTRARRDGVTATAGEAAGAATGRTEPPAPVVRLRIRSSSPTATVPPDAWTVLQSCATTVPTPGSRSASTT